MKYSTDTIIIFIIFTNSGSQFQFILFQIRLESSLLPLIRVLVTPKCCFILFLNKKNIYKCWITTYNFLNINKFDYIALN